MTRKWLCKWIGIFGLVSASMWLLSLSSCARSTQLTGIRIQPSTGTFGAVDPNANFGFKAFGTYIHPPKTVDITDQVNWQSNNPQVIQITARESPRRTSTVAWRRFSRRCTAATTIS